MNMRTFIRTLFALGLGLLAFGHIKWIDYRHLPLDAKVWLIPFVVIPGYAALVMGWTGWLMDRLFTRLSGKRS